MDAINKECRCDWSHQVSAMTTAQWLQRDQTVPFSAKDETQEIQVAASLDTFPCSVSYILHNTHQLNLNSAALA